MISVKHLLSVTCLLSGILLSAAPWSANSDFKQLDSPERTAARKKGMLTRGIVFTGAPTFGLMGEGTLTELGIEIKNTHK